MGEKTVDHPAGPLVLFCIDGLEHSSRAFSWYHKNFYRNDHTLGLVQVYTTAETPHHDDNENENRQAEAKKKSNALTRQFQEFCSRKGIKARIYTEEKEDSIGHTICKLAKEHGAELIIMGRRGLGTIKRAIYGSVSEYVLHHAHVPVLIVPPEENEH